MRNCVDIVRPFIEESNRQGYDIQAIGGVGSAALLEPSTIIVPNEQIVIAPADLYLPQFREDGNRRDFDAIVKTTDQSVVERIENEAEAIIGDELELSFFGLRAITQLDQQRRQWPLSLAKVWVGDRYVRMSGGEVTSAQKALFPFTVNVDVETLESWQLLIGEHDPYPTPIPNPAQTILNYATRAIHGVRPKDAAKVDKLTHEIFKKYPQGKDWMLDGPGKSHVELARLLGSLGRIPYLAGYVKVSDEFRLKPYTDKLAEHPAFMMGDASTAVQGIIISTTVLKAMLNRTGESMPAFVTFWQKHIEPKINKVIKNEWNI